MLHPLVRAAAIIFVAAAAASLAGNPAYAAAGGDNAIVTNRGVVELETGPASDISVQMAGELAGIIDDGATRRVVPVVGKGPFQNLTDLKYLHGVDLAIVQSDALYYARDQRLFPRIQSSLTYITKLYNSELHLLARVDIKQVNDLAGQTVNVDVKGSGTAVTAGRLFELLKLKTGLANDPPAVALQKLRKGEIAAVALLAATPAPLLQSLKPGEGLHLLSIPLTEAVTNAYPPTRITDADYPNLVATDKPADTIAVGNVLMAADLRSVPDRYRSIQNFVDTFFTGFQGLLEPGHSRKWREINIAAELPGWTRHPAAEQWLLRNSQIAAGPNPEALKVLFSRFIEEHRQQSGAGPMSEAEKNALFQQFEAWQRGQRR